MWSPLVSFGADHATWWLGHHPFGDRYAYMKPSTPPICQDRIVGLLDFPRSVACQMVNVLEALDLPWLPDALARTEVRLKESVAAEDPYLTEIAGHLISACGKRLRPFLAMAAAAAGGGSVNDDVITFGVSVELVHRGSRSQ